ncbi:MAG: hypothetical protein V4660_00790 [Pseudomonadota bacterium]
MGNNRRKQITNTHRVVIPEITPLEIWDCITPQGILWDSMYKQDFPEILKNVIQQIHVGLAVTASQLEINPAAMAFDAIYVAGGGALDPRIIHSLKQLSVPIIVAEDPVFSGVPGGNKILANHGLEGIVIDVGQTQIKIASVGGLHTFKRDFDSIPIRSEAETDQDVAQLQAFVRYVSSSIVEAIKDTAKPKGIVLALPCDINHDGILGGSSYTGMKNNTDLVDSIIRHANLEDVQVLLLNDAELTAASALQDKNVIKFKKILVITLGFAVGATILEPKCD